MKLLETPEETITKIPYLTGLDCCLSEEDKRNCHTYVTSIMTVTVIFIFVPLVLSLLCVLFRVYSYVVRECLCGCTTRTRCLMNVMHFWFYVTYHIFKTIPFLRIFLFYQM